MIFVAKYWCLRCSPTTTFALRGRTRFDQVTQRLVAKPVSSDLIFTNITAFHLSHTMLHVIPAQLRQVLERADRRGWHLQFSGQSAAPRIYAITCCRLTPIPRAAVASRPRAFAAMLGICSNLLGATFDQPGSPTGWVCRRLTARHCVLRGRRTSGRAVVAGAVSWPLRIS